MLLALAGIGFTAAAGAAADHWLPFQLLATVFLLDVALLLAAWWRHGRDELPFKALLLVPLYMLWKIPIYTGFFTRRQTGWNRTRRASEDD
jgi:hypothetical protein